MLWVKWGDEYLTGILVIDEQHEKLVNMINDFGAKMLEGQGEKEVMHLFQKMAEYVDYHFGTEEKLMDKYAYPNKAEHCAQHHEFIGNLASYILEHNQGKRLLSLEVHKYLRDWLVDHILDHTTKADRQLAKYLLQEGYK